jgi:hypothetical protein
MAHYRLGQRALARRLLEELRDVVIAAPWSAYPEARAFLDEPRALISGQVGPEAAGGKGAKQ